MSMSPMPSPYVRQNASSSRTWSAMRRMRPPVAEVSPVSTNVTFHGSARFWCTCMLFACMSKVTSDMCRK